MGPILLFFITVFISTAYAELPFSERQPVDLLLFTSVLEDSNESVDCNNVTNATNAARFLPVKNNTLMLDNKEVVYWLRINLGQLFFDHDRFILYIPYRPFDQLSYVIPQTGSDCHSKNIGQLESERTPLGNAIHYHFNIDRKNANTNGVIYLRVDNRTQAVANSLPIYLFDTDGYYRKNLQLHLYMAAYYSVMASLLIFIFFIFIRVREPAYLYYSSYLLTTLLISTFLDGSYYTAFVKQAGPISYRLLLIATITQSLLHLLFVKQIIYGNEKIKTVSALCFSFLLLGSGLMVAHALMPLGHLNSLLNIIYMTIIALFTLGLAFTAAVKQLPFGRTLALLLLIHYGLLVINTLYLRGIFPDNTLAPWIGHLSYLAEALLFSMVLATQVIRLRSQVSLADHGQRIAHEMAGKEKKENIEKTLFLARASHDLRQPLHSLSLYTAALNLKTSDKELQAIIKQMRTSIFAMQEMFGDILDISRLETNILIPHIETFPIREVLQSLENEVSLLAKEKNITLVVMSNCKWHVKTDIIFLKRILRNFIENAIHYTPQGKIVVGCRYKKNTLRVDVIDTGIGIGDENQQDIFNEFFRCEDQAEQQGLGLGLAIVKRLADKLEHPIEVKSTIGRGSRFSITLPLASKDESVAYSSVDSLFDDPLYALEDTIIAVIDDEESIRNSLSLYLEARGCIVIKGANSNEIIKQLEEARVMPELLLVDYHLRHHTGLDAINEIHQHFGDPTIPVILITGNTSIENLAQLQAKGFCILSKPVDPSSLEREIIEKITRA